MQTGPMESAYAGREESLTVDPPDLRLIRGGEPRSPAPAPAESRRPAARPAARAALPDATVINKDVSLNGDLRADGHVQFNGRIEGNVYCKGLLAGDKARIAGAVVAEAVLIAGCVAGPIRAARVTLKATARVDGDILCEWIKMEEGAHFDGRIQRVEFTRTANPTARPEMRSIADMLHEQ